MHLLTEIGYGHKLKDLTGFGTKDVRVVVPMAKHWQGTENVQHLNYIFAFRTPASIAI